MHPTQEYPLSSESKRTEDTSVINQSVSEFLRALDCFTNQIEQRESIRLPETDKRAIVKTLRACHELIEMQDEELSEVLGEELMMQMQTYEIPAKDNERFIDNFERWSKTHDNKD